MCVCVCLAYGTEFKGIFGGVGGEIIGIQLPDDVCPVRVFAHLFHCTRVEKESAREESVSDSCFYLGCRCNAAWRGAKCLGHTRFIQIDLALLSGNGLLNVNFRINSTRAARLYPSVPRGGTGLLNFISPQEFSLRGVCLINSNFLFY